MGSLGNIPFLRPTLAFCFGIGISLYLVREACPGMSAIFYSVLLLVGLAYLTGLFAQRNLQVLSGIMLLLSLTALGFSLAYFAQQPLYPNHFAQPNRAGYVQLKLVLDEEISAKANSWRCRGRVIEAYDSTGIAWAVEGNLLVYWPHRSNAVQPSLQYGDEIIVQNKSIAMPSAAFPGDFDFKAVMRYKNVQHQIFLQEKGWKFTGNQGSMLFRFAFACRAALVKKLHELLPAEQAGLMASLMIGFREELGQDDMKAFAVSGTTHVLAVSGLHVGLLYLLLVLILTGKRRSVRLSQFQGALIIIVLWAFALITGLSVSVVRAALMFSILETGRTLVGRRGNLLNSLFAAAFIQLLLDPLSLIDAGFQLSYLAVLGIAVLHPFLNQIWVPRSMLLFYLYQSATLSIAATITTLPVTLYYFKSFPIWFIPANLWIVPLSTVVIVAGLVVLALGFIPLLGGFLVAVTTWLSKLLVGSAHFFAELPWASITNIMFNDLETLLLAIMVFGVCGYLVNKRMVFAKIAIVVCILLGSLGFYQHSRLVRAEELIACELRGELLLVQKTGQEMHIYSRPISGGKADSLYGFMKNYVLGNGIQKVQWHMAGDGMSEVQYMANGNGLLNLNHRKWLLAWNYALSEDVPAEFTVIYGKRKRKALQSLSRRLELNNAFIILE